MPSSMALYLKKFLWNNLVGSLTPLILIMYAAYIKLYMALNKRLEPRILVYASR